MEENFLKAVENLEKMMANYGIEKQSIVRVDDQEGVFLTVGKAMVVYSLPLLQTNVEEYLAEQRESHSAYARWMENSVQVSYRDLQRFKSPFSAFVFRKLHRLKWLEHKIMEKNIAIAAITVVKEGAFLGKQFFTEIFKEEGYFTEVLQSSMAEYKTLPKVQEDHAALLQLTTAIYQTSDVVLGNNQEILENLNELRELHT